MSQEQRFFFGIDLGTTNSVAACYDAAKGTCTTILHKHSPLVKSQIWRDTDGLLQVGAVPYDKRDLIETVKDVKSSMLLNSGFSLGSAKYTAVEVSTFVLEALKNLINEQYRDKVGHDITNVTITVPAAFNNIQRSNTLKAAKNAGLNIVSLINEPTSAALAYVDNIKKQETILIYDLGGGTFDVSIVTIAPGVPALKLPKIKINIPAVQRQMVTVMRSDGDTRLGGNDIDRLMVEIALHRKGIQTIEPHIIKPLLRAAQHFKETDGSVTSVEVDGTTVVFDQDIYVQATQIIFEKTAKIVKNLMNTVGAVGIDRIVFVGGSTKNDYLCREVAAMFSGVPVYKDINPDECVAIGAAKNSFIMSGATDSIAFTDIVAGTYSIFVMTEDGPALQKMLLKGEPLPASKTLTVTKTAQDQTQIHIPIYQGENISYKLNHQIGVLQVDNVPSSYSIDDSIPCTLQVNKSGVLVAKANVAGKEYVTTIDTTSIEIVGDEKNEMLNDLEDFISHEFS